MATPRVKTEPRFTQGGMRLVLCVVLAGCASIVVAIPVPVLPRERPSLVIRRNVDEALLERDRRRAATAPDDAAARSLDAVVLDAGRLESHAAGRTDLAFAAIERRALASRSAVVSAHGEASIAALRAKAVLRFVATFDAGRGTDAGRAAAIVGGFRLALTRWNAVRGGRTVAPPLVVRTLYAARWNTIVGQRPTQGMTREELRAYHGWLALHAESVGRELRIQATAAFAEAGGGDAADEALAMLLLEDGSTVSAETAFERLYERTHLLRLRNHALAAHVLAR